MLFIKGWYRFTGLIVKTLYRVIYGRSMSWGKGLHMRRGFQVTVEHGGTITIGNHVFFNNDCGLHARTSISIGDETIFGEHVLIYDHNHRFANPGIPIKDQGYSEAPVFIGSHCWIGSNVVVLKGVTIGDRVVIGAGCVITDDIPSDTVVRLTQQLHLEEVRQ